MKLQLLKQRIDYTQLVEGNNLDYCHSEPVCSKVGLCTYHKKFAMWDYVMENKLEGTMEAIRICNDPTIYAYAFFKNDKGEPFKLTAYQDAIVNIIVGYDFNPFHPARHVLYRAANQTGKSALDALMAIYWLNNGVNECIVIVSNNLDNSKRVLREIKFLLNNSHFSGWRENAGDTDNMTMLSLEKDEGRCVNRIICAPSGEGLLGYPVTRLILDEVDFYEEGKHFFWKVAYPRLGKTKGQIICTSNPNPDVNKSNSILYELESGSLFLRRFHFDFLDAPWNSQAEYDTAKRNSPAHLFASTHDGEYSDLAGSFFKDAEIKDMLRQDWSCRPGVYPSVDRKVYIAADVGKQKDNTVIGIGITKEPLFKDDKYKDLDIVYLEVLPLGTEYGTIAERLKEVKDFYDKNYYGAEVAFDSTGQKTFDDFLKKAGIPAKGVDFSKKETNKTILYNDFKLMAEKRKVKMVYDYRAEKQLSSLVFKVSENKKLRPGASAEKASEHDDIPDMMAIMINVAVRPGRVPVSLSVVFDDVKPEQKEVSDEEHRKKYEDDVKNSYRQTIASARKNSFEDNFMRRYGGM